MSALKLAGGGDTILLAPGVYSGLAIRNLSFATDVTITSADPDRLAVITDMQMHTVRNLTFTNLEFAANTGGFAYEIRNSDSIHLDRLFVHGSLDGNPQNDVSGIGFAASTNISITGSTFEQLNRGMAISDSSNIVMRGNVMHDLRSDGVDFAQVSNVQILNNTFRTFKPTPEDHPDAIQFWTSGTKVASHDILISGNVIMRGEGQATQGIFLRDEIGTLPYERVTIANNIIVGTGYNGIRVIGAKDLEITGNQLYSNPGDVNRTFMLVQNADGVRATDNTAVSITFEKVTGLTQASNVFNSAVGDEGVSMLRDWTLNHPETAASVRSFLPPAPPPGLAPDPMSAFGQAGAFDPNGFNPSGIDPSTFFGGWGITFS